MRILFIITDYGSFNNFLGEVAVNLINRGHQVDVICSPLKVIDCDDKYPYKEKGINLHFADFPRGFNIIEQCKACRVISSLIQKIGPDVISIHFTTAMFTTLLLGRLKVNTIGTFHGVGYPIIEGKIKKIVFKIVEQFCCKRLDQIWVLNRFDHNLLSVIYPKKVQLLETKGLGCNLNRFNRDNFEEIHLRALKCKLGINSEDFVLTFTGRFVRFKGFSLVVNAFRYATEVLKEANLKLILIGGKDNLHESGLTNEQDHWYNQNENVVDVGFTSVVEKYLSITDLFVFPSEREGMPVCIIEALAMGIPILTSDTRGCNDLVVNGVNGLVLKSNPTVKAVAKSIIDIKNDHIRRNLFRTNILRDRDNLDRMKFVSQQIEMFEKV